MNKKLILIFLISLFLVSIIAPNVCADENKKGAAGIIEPIYNIFSTITFDIGKLTEGKLDEHNVFVIRLLLFIALFSIVFFVANTILFKGHKNIAMGISAALSLLGTIGIPAEVLVELIRSYVFFVIVAIMAIPVLAIFYARKFILESFEDHPAGARGLLALCFLVLATLLNSLNSAILKIGIDKSLAESYLPYITMVVGFCWFFFIWYILSMAFGLIGGAGKFAIQSAEKGGEYIKEHYEPGAIEEGAKAIGRGAKKAGKKIANWASGETILNARELKSLTDIQKSLNKTPPNRKQIEKDLDDLEGYVERNRQIENTIVYLLNKLESLESTPALKKEIENIKRLERIIFQQDKKLAKFVENTYVYVSEKKINKAKEEIKKAIGLDKKIYLEIKNLNKIFRRVRKYIT